MAGKPNILLVEDSASLASVYQNYLKDQPFDVIHADTGQGALDAIRSHFPPVVLLDLNLPDMDGMDILQWIQDQQLPTAVIIITAHGTVDRALHAMRLGVYDFLEKPFSADRLTITVNNALERTRLTNMVETFKEDSREQFEGFIGASLVMQAVYRIVESAAPSKASVFITGESGTGKEVCAEAIHRCSDRKDGPFVAINCAAIPKDLMESEIFGHVKGAFTGAVAPREGAASRANGGTLFLDEIGEMDMDLQAKLLRFIQTGGFQKVGGNKLEQVDVRFVAATNKEPLALVGAGKFREDLYYRLHVIPIQLPPLRDRDEDVLLIARRFLTSFNAEEGKPFKGYTPETEQILRAYTWPGNVRELQNVVRNIVVLNTGSEVSPDMLPPPLNTVVAEASTSAIRPSSGVQQSETESVAPATPAQIRPLWQVEMEIIEQAIAICDDNIPKAAAMLEISASTIYRKRQTWKDKGLID